MQDEDQDNDEAPASQVRQRYERLFREKQNAGTELSEGKPAALEATAQTAFQGAISTVFAKYLKYALLSSEPATFTLFCNKIA